MGQDRRDQRDGQPPPDPLARPVAAEVRRRPRRDDHVGCGPPRGHEGLLGPLRDFQGRGRHDGAHLCRRDERHDADQGDGRQPRPAAHPHARPGDAGRGRNDLEDSRGSRAEDRRTLPAELGRDREALRLSERCDPSSFGRLRPDTQAVAAGSPPRPFVYAVSARSVCRRTAPNRPAKKAASAPTISEIEAARAPFDAAEAAASAASVPFCFAVATS